MVHWLKLCISNAGSTGSVPGWETKIPCAVWCGQRGNKGEKKRYEKYGTCPKMQILIDGIEMRAQK